jgi:hypothetical protein
MEKELQKQLKPIYEQIGGVVQSSQQMEFAIGYALTLLKQLNSTQFSDEEFEGSMDLFSDKTLGRLIGEFKKYIELDERAIKVLKVALKERNYIIHRFFNENIEEFVSVKGRQWALGRIREARKNIHPGFMVLDTVVQALLKVSGISAEQIMENVKSKIEI